MAHGPLMINGFLATLISLERGATLGKLWSYVVPLSLILSTILFQIGVIYSGGFLLLRVVGNLLYLPDIRMAGSYGNV